jgi:hypothetical protein
VSRRTKQVCVILALLAMAVFVASWPIYMMLTLDAASAALADRTNAVVGKNPHLRPDWDEAMKDGVLTRPEAEAILGKVGEKVGPEE